MKKLTVAVLIFILLFVFGNISFAATSILKKSDSPADTVNNPNAEILANEFTDTAMAEFSSVSAQISSGVVSFRTHDYAFKMAKTLLDSGIDAKTITMIMQKASAWYGNALVAVYNEKNYSAVIEGYVNKIADLFNQQQLDVKAQSQIAFMATEHLQMMHSLFKDIR